MIDRYQIRGVLGEGAMGRVHLGYDPKFDREVAIKTIRDTMLGDERARKWFHREARAMAQLQHSGIVRVHDYSGADAAVPFVVMERLQGHTLGVLLERLGVFEAQAIIEVAIQIGSALAHAHGQGLVHRDLKPDNIFLEPDGRVVITDFGLARAQMNVDLGASLAAVSSTVVGTPVYMAPEVVTDGKAASPASDIYGAGVVLYQLAMLDPPFAGDAFGVVSKILSGVHKPVNRRDISAPLAAAIEQCFAVDPKARPTDVEGLFASLRTVPDSLGALRAFLQTPEEDTATVVGAPTFDK